MCVFPNYSQLFQHYDKSLSRVLDIFELKLLPRGYYTGYNESVNPTIANAFAAAAFRFGHSLVKDSISR